MKGNERRNRGVRKSGWIVLFLALTIPYNLAKLAALASGLSESSAFGIGLAATLVASVAGSVIHWMPGD